MTGARPVRNGTEAARMAARAAGVGGRAVSKTTTEAVRGAEKGEQTVEVKDNLRTVWKVITRKQKRLLALMVVIVIASAVLLIVSLIVLRPTTGKVRVGYADAYESETYINLAKLFQGAAGYRYAGWVNVFAYPVLAVVYAVLHNLLIMRVFRKYGHDTAVMVGVVTLMLIAATFVVMLRIASVING